MAPNPSESQKDVGQFNAWLHNIGQTKVPQHPQQGGSAPSAAQRPAPRPAVPPGGGILGNVDSDVDDVFGRIMTDGPVAAPPPSPGYAAPRPAPQAPPPSAVPPQPAPRTEPPKAPPSRADVDRIIAAAQAQLRPAAAPPPAAAPVQPAQRAPVPAAPPAALAQPISVFGRPVTQTQPLQTAPRPVPQPAAPPVTPAIPALALSAQQTSAAQLEAASGGNQALIAQMQQAHQQELARVENSFLETKNQLQKQVKDIQLKYQEQRGKWENVLADLRIRNDELLRRNQELEQQIEQMTERHHQLIQEYADVRGQMGAGGAAPQPQTAPLPEEIGVPQGQLLKGEFEIPAVAVNVPVPGAGGINIEPPLPEQGQPAERSFEPTAAPARITPEMSFQIPAEPPAQPPLPDEADDLLAELEALEKEMKDIGGK